MDLWSEPYCWVNSSRIGPNIVNVKKKVIYNNLRKIGLDAYVFCSNYSLTVHEGFALKNSRIIANYLFIQLHIM